MSTKDVNKVQPFKADGWKFAGHAYREHSVVVPHGVNLEEVLKPENWAFLANRFSKYDEVRVSCADGSWFAWFLVESVATKSVKLAQIGKTLELVPAEHKERTVTRDGLKYTIRFKSPDKRYQYCIFRQSGNKASEEQMILKGYESPAKAESALEDHFKKVA